MKTSIKTLDERETFSLMHELFSYDPATGLLTRKGGCPELQSPKGKVLGYQDGRGYLAVSAAGRSYRIHRIAWLMSYERWPLATIDHINRVKTDNRLCNLREASMGENVMNRGLHRNNKSGATGVWWSKQMRRYVAQIDVAGKRTYIGSYLTIDSARAAYEEKASECFGAFKRIDSQHNQAEPQQ